MFSILYYSNIKLYKLLFLVYEKSKQFNLLKPPLFVNDKSDDAKKKNDCQKPENKYI